MNTVHRALLTFSLLTPAVLYGQKEANYWYFGENAGMQFAGGPKAEPCGQMVTQEGCTSWSDPVTGQLVLYSDGYKVWDASHNIMQNGNFLLAAGGSTVQSSVVIPQPGNDSILFLFTKELYGGPLGYSVINRKANGGLGAVITKNVILKNDSLGEVMAAVKHGNGTDYWVTLHGCVGSAWWGVYEADTTFSSYLVTAAGVNPVPVVSTYNLSKGGSGASCGCDCNVGQNVFSQDGKYLASGVAGAVFKFDNNTGKVDTVASAYMWNHYGVAFSPDGTKLYTCTSDLNQFDLTAGGGNPDSIYNSMVTIASSTNWAAAASLQLGPDGKIYLARHTEGFLGVISNPNALGTACNYIHNGVALGGKLSRIGLPNFAVPIHMFSGPAAQTPSFLGDDTLSCNGSPLELNAGYPSAAYLWSTGDTTQTITASTAGTYWVKVTYGGCQYTDTVFVVTGTGPVVKATGDTTIFQGDSAQVKASSGFSSYTWTPTEGLSDSLSANPVASPDSTTTYYVTALDSNGCPSTDSVTVIIKFKEPVDTIKCSEVFLPNAFSPNNDQKNDTLVVRGNCIASMKLVIMNRWGEEVFVSEAQASGWDGTVNGRTTQEGVFAYHLTAVLTDGTTLTQRGNITLVR